MQAIQVKEFGDAGVMEVVQLPKPDPAPHEILIKTGVSGIVFADTQMRRGDYVNPPQLPYIPGREVAGFVEKVGAEVGSAIQPGMRVSAEMHTGGYAEYAVADASTAIILPDHVSFGQAIVCHNNLRVAYLYYYTFGNIQPGQTLLIHAAAGGIGTLVTHIAKRRGNNTVIALGSSDEKRNHCLSAGADYFINYKQQNYVEEVLRITDGQGVDVSLNSVAGATFQTDPQVIKPCGLWLINGYAGGHALIDPKLIMPKSLTLKIFSIYTVRKDKVFEKATEFLYDWLENEQLDDCTRMFDLSDAVAAHQYIESRKSVGKVAFSV